MKSKKIVKYCIETMLNRGADKAECYLTKKEQDELNVEHGDINLFRTNFDKTIHLKAIMEGKKGTYSINKEDEKALSEAVEKVLAIATTSEPDPANDIAPKQPSKTFNAGPSEIDATRMYDSMEEFLKYAKNEYPKTIYEQLILDFTKSNTYFMNSNGVDFQTNKGIYSFSAMFTSKDGDKTSSFNYTGFQRNKLDKPLQEYGYLDELLNQSSEQTETKSFPGKIKGDIIITPHCLNQFISYITRYLRDYYLITGKSIFKDKMNKPIASDNFTLHSKPRSEKMHNKYFITSDGFEAHDSTIVKDGILKSFLLSLYGSNKTGLDRAKNQGGRWIIEPGNNKHEDLIKNVSNGILLCRFSGGNPNNNGDFSGVAKNSYYIKDGEIQFPLNETMIAGNLAEMLKNIQDVSKDRLDFGASILPWIRFKDVFISGK